MDPGVPAGVVEADFDGLAGPIAIAPGPVARADKGIMGTFGLLGDGSCIIGVGRGEGCINAPPYIGGGVYKVEFGGCSLA